MWHYFHRRQMRDQWGKPLGWLRQTEPGKRCGPSSGGEWRRGRFRAHRSWSWLRARGYDIRAQACRLVDNRGQDSKICLCAVRSIYPDPRDEGFSSSPLSVHSTLTLSSPSFPPNELSLVCGLSPMVNFSRHCA